MMKRRLGGEAPFIGCDVLRARKIERRLASFAWDATPFESRPIPSLGRRWTCQTRAVTFLSEIPPMRSVDAR